MPDESLYGLFERRFAAAGDRLAFRDPSGAALLTYAELSEAVGRMANALLALGVEPGERVTVQTEKSVAAVALYLATLKCGAVYHPLNTSYTLAEADYFVGDAAPRVIVCEPSRQQAMRELGDRHKVTAVVNLDGRGEGSLDRLAARMDSRHETVARSAGALAGLLYTSGTTGRSKGAMLSHGNLMSNAETLVKLWDFQAGDVLLHALPVYHVHGLFVALNTAFLNHTEIVWFDRLDAEALIDWFPRATTLMGVPTFYARLLASPRLTPQACAGMRLFISGSAPLLAETHRAFAERTGHAILERYGMTETGMIASNPCHGERIAGTVGFALPDVDLRIADAAGHDVADGELGVIEVKGPNVFGGYWRMPEKTLENFRKDGFFITGDIGKKDEQGRVTLIGRAKDLVISGGFNIYPKEIEEALDGLSGVTESAVIGVPHPDFGEGVVAVVCGSAPPAEAEMIATLARTLAKFKLPKRIFVLDELPRNAMGKVQKAELRRAFGAAFTPS